MGVGECCVPTRVSVRGTYTIAAPCLGTVACQSALLPVDGTLRPVGYQDNFDLSGGGLRPVSQPVASLAFL